MSTVSEASDLTSGQRIMRFLEGLGVLLVRLLPVAVAITVFAIAGHTVVTRRASQDIADLESLVKLSLSMTTGVAVYVIISEFTLRRLPGRLAREVRKLDTELVLLKNLTNDLHGVVLQQIHTLTALSDMQVFFDHDQALVQARRLHESASKRVDAMWTLVPYDDTLRTYFSETLAVGLYTCRIVAAHTVSREHLRDHIASSWEYLAAGTYEIYVVHECNYEALIVDNNNAGLFFYSSQGYGSCFLSSKSPDFVNVVIGLVAGLKRADGRVPIRQGDARDLDAIDSWLDGFYAQPS
ncbi:MAG TPA: hypothetical protein VFG31_10755 [Conexibacter sp.]|nr:hypothetical protein [Conexibacter sp.]